MSDVFQSRICVVAVLTNCEWTVGNKLKKKKKQKHTEIKKERTVTDPVCNNHVVKFEKLHTKTTYG